VFTALIIAVLIVAGAASAVGGVLVWAAQRRHALEGGGSRKQLGPAAPALLERGVRDLRSGDIIQHGGVDYLVEGILSYDEDGHGWIAGRLVDGDDERWLVVGMERVGSASLRLCQVDDELEVSGYPPDLLTSKGTRYKLERRGTATVQPSGEAGVIPGAADLAPQSVLRCRWWRYEAPGAACLIVEQWGGEFRVLRGATVGDSDLEMMPGS
jgi:hypothetical protein